MKALRLTILSAVVATAALAVLALTVPGSATANTGYHNHADGRLVVVTNFARADVEVNGDPYPAYSDDLQNRGMALAPFESHLVVVEYNGNERVYEVELRPGERRMLMVDLTGMDASDDRSERRERPPRRDRRADDDDDDGDDTGRLTIYSRPRGTIHLNGEATGDRTPETIHIEPGRHQVRVEYDDGEMSETKTARVREGSRVQLFFRED